MINISNISFGYTDKAVFKNFSLNISDGEFIAVTGAGGSGKSTLARLINGLLLPQNGTIEVGGMKTSDESKLHKIRQNASLVFQNPDDQLICAVVEDDAAFGAENLGIEPNEIRRRVDNALETVGLADKAKASVAHLSGGEKQRLAIAGSLVMQPKILILDEATSMLDPICRNRIMRLLHKINSDGVTVIMITHRMEEAAQAKRCIVLSEGSIRLDGTPQEVFCHDLTPFRLAAPMMKQLAEKLNEDGIPVPDNVLDVNSMTNFLNEYFTSSCEAYHLLQQDGRS